MLQNPFKRHTRQNTTNKQFINNKIVKCKTSDIDRYKRYIAICFVNNININRVMVKKGWALSYIYYSDDYINEEKYAKKNKVGLWKSIFENPYIYRKKNKK